MTPMWVRRIERLAEDILEARWPEDWATWDETDVRSLAEDLEAAAEDCWFKFRDDKNADRTAAFMDARPR